MARPKYEAGQRTARERLEDAFWELLERHPVSEITVGMLCTRAGCNRGTFYYHFDAIEDLAERVAAENLPRQCPALVRGYLRGAAPAVAFDEEEKRDIERLCLLVGSHSTPEIVRAAKAALVAARLDDLGLSWDELDMPAKTVVAFMADGILGALVRHAEDEDAAMSERADLNQVFATVFDTFTKPALDRLRASLPSDRA